MRVYEIGRDVVYVIYDKLVNACRCRCVHTQFHSQISYKHNAYAALNLIPHKTQFYQSINSIATIQSPAPTRVLPVFAENFVYRFISCRTFDDRCKHIRRYYQHFIHYSSPFLMQKCLRLIKRKDKNKTTTHIVLTRKSS